MTIAANITLIQERIAAVCQNCGRNADEVRLVAVSKKKPAEDIETAVAAGQTLLGESYVQECVAKIDAVKVAAEWHFIGALQSNKVKYLRSKVSCIPSSNLVDYPTSQFLATNAAFTAIVRVCRYRKN